MEIALATELLAKARIKEDEAVRAIAPLLEGGIHGRFVERAATDTLKLLFPHSVIAAPELIIKSYKYHDWVARDCALEILRMIGDSAIPVLVQSLDTWRHPTKLMSWDNERLAMTMGRLGDPALNELKKLIRAKNPEFKLWAATALGVMGEVDDRAVKELLKAFPQEKEGRVLEKMAQSIRRSWCHPDVKEIPPSLTYARDGENPQVRKLAKLGLKDWNEKHFSYNWNEIRKGLEPHVPETVLTIPWDDEISKIPHIKKDNLYCLRVDNVGNMYISHWERGGELLKFSSDGELVYHLLDLDSKGINALNQFWGRTGDLVMTKHVVDGKYVVKEKRRLFRIGGSGEIIQLKGKKWSDVVRRRTKYKFKTLWKDTNPRDVIYPPGGAMPFKPMSTPHFDGIYRGGEKEPFILIPGSFHCWILENTMIIGDDRHGNLFVASALHHPQAPYRQLRYFLVDKYSPKGDLLARMYLKPYEGRKETSAWQMISMDKEGRIYQLWIDNNYGIQVIRWGKIGDAKTSLRPDRLMSRQ